MHHWSKQAVFYHIYPLGLLGAEHSNHNGSASTPRILHLMDWIPYLQQLGMNAVYLGPIFESDSHGYDTRDYFHIDRRLGSNEDFRQVAAAFSAAGIRIVLDGVFNHVGRGFWAFQDVLEHGADSPWCAWFQGLDFQGRSPYGDPFTYETWEGHYSLVKLNLHHPAVKQHLLDAVAMWIDTFGISGLRLDAADCVDLQFQQDLASFCRDRKSDFWLLGEVIHGEYRTWANPQTLDSVTNYECYKGLWSAHNDRNLFEIAYAFNRQFGDGGIYRDLNLYSFLDNHDVERLASVLQRPEHLYTCYLLLFTMPGIPSIYYGSEWGLGGRKNNGSDWPLRPALQLDVARQTAPHPDLEPVIARLAMMRKTLPALRHGDYRQLYLTHEQLVFARRADQQQLIVALNLATESVTVDFPFCDQESGCLHDVLNPGRQIRFGGQHIRVDLGPGWGRVMEISDV